MQPMDDIFNNPKMQPMLLLSLDELLNKLQKQPMDDIFNRGSIQQAGLLPARIVDLEHVFQESDGTTILREKGPGASIYRLAPQPVKAPIKAPVYQPIQFPILAPIKAPVHQPIPFPILDPIKAPVRAPVYQPIAGGGGRFMDGNKPFVENRPPIQDDDEPIIRADPTDGDGPPTEYRPIGGGVNRVLGGYQPGGYNTQGGQRNWYLDDYYF
ncbi:hypothetical protein FPQ18DRAFT_301427 [Pyronema domesticum]|uniref:Uncharacterized protein n=1 Tax=Pyronema omphalodes (strain CBS 100304) TaxID=1076935 RepID=U4L5W1_PYROM|nr:hypothetical protein FPQ18DRAFT_301427 [Pyronema domesticum]CCX12591.1 Protein of unknown function [Pyronema omphalodes CBS 100304]